MAVEKTAILFIFEANRFPLKNYLLLLLSLAIFGCKENKTKITIKHDPDFERGRLLFDEGNDSAYYYFNNVTSKQKNRLTVAEAYCYMSMIQSNAGDFYGSQESAVRSLKLLNENKKEHWDCIASDYNQLGLTSMQLKRFSLALAYFNKAIPYFTRSESQILALNNKAWAHQQLKQYPEAVEIYKRILSKKTSRAEYARFLSNAARTKWLERASYNSLPEFLTALQIRQNEKNDWGLNTSYSHLADYYANKNPDSALFYARQMYQVATKLNSADDQLEALDKLIKLSPASAVKDYFGTYQHINDSLQTSRNAAKNQFAVVRYESEKSKADNLILQKEITEKRYQILKREILLGFGFLLFISTSVIAFLWYKKRQQKLALEKESAIQENKFKISKKVHDVVANGLYRVMSEMENNPDIDRVLVIDKIEELYEKSRDISYDKPDLDQQEFNEKVSILLTAFATKDTKVITVGNTALVWDNVLQNVKYELEHILQELMVNMKKHSKADTVVFKFEREPKKLSIFYSDNGIGIVEEKFFNNGLQNTVSRIDAINGSIIFETKLEKGLKIHISIPVS